MTSQKDRSAVVLISRASLDKTVITLLFYCTKYLTVRFSSVLGPALLGKRVMHTMPPSVSLSVTLSSEHTVFLSFTMVTMTD